ncbi:MAG: sodium ion-translocating decarboxylase subunit beta, partial [Anaerolineales bacterium]|nr:sodium ion-translocating decarboxylase subunit beta [Anaerolineales bacterium]
MNLLELLANVFGGLTFTWANALMLLIGGALIYLAVAKEYEPVLLLPIGFGCILANLGMSVYADGSFLQVIYKAGIETELFPLLVFIGVGAMIDFRPLLAQPSQALLGAAGQYGIYG